MDSSVEATLGLGGFVRNLHWHHLCLGVDTQLEESRLKFKQWFKYILEPLFK